ncbi:MAG: TIGR03619 family F420-dependent LLM class oxidoreductase, partial [Deltaproteobacteria bacterium]|nr:TIGR03619 family F420-dependent LLM class oxidoreductase [Deltaproteobacteria bacterium]
MHADRFAVGIGLPIVQQVPTQAQAWEAAAGPAEILRVARAAERAGFAWVTCSDHVAVPASHAASMGATWYEPATTLAYVAAATERIGLLSHVLVLPYRHPLQAAKLFATLDRLSGGRAILGAGSGHLKPEFRSLGIDHAARAALSDEYLAAIATALEQEVSSFTGTSVHWRDMHVSPRPVQQPRPPLWVGGNTPAMARRAGRLADGWIPWQLAPEAFAAGAALARAARAERAPGLPFTVVAPVAGGAVEHCAALVETLADWRRRGATAAHLGLRHRSLDE